MSYIFLMNVGAEKAATTWMHEYMVSHPQYVAAPTKEMNVIDYPSTVPPSNFENSDLFKQDLNYYFDYFENLVKFHGRVSGDFTHYEGCTGNIFNTIKEGFRQRGITVKAVYTLRDPITRAWSAYNMIENYSEGLYGHSGHKSFDMPATARLCLDSMLSCKYVETMETLKTCFGDDSKFLFYETMFDQKTMDGLCDFIGIEHKQADFSIVNNSERAEKIPEQFIELFGKSKKNIAAYAFMEDKYGSEFMRNIWSGYEII